ncbi:peptide chain release factor-like protein [Nitrospira sp. Kam-Ns4a]
MKPAPGSGTLRFSTDRATLEREVVVHTYRAGGPGGQHRNVTDSAVRLHHPPSGVTVTAADSRSQHRNREVVFERLIRRLEALNRRRPPRRPTRMPEAAVERRLADKRWRQRVKQRRGRVRDLER